MITRSMRKILSGIVIATYLVVYAAPMGMCVSAVPQMNAAVQKPALRASAVPSALKLEGDISLSKKNPNISLSLRDSDVKQVLRMFADKAGLNIIFHASVDQKDSTSTEDSNNNSASSDNQNAPPPTNMMNGQYNSDNRRSPAGGSSASSGGSSSNSSSYTRKVTLDLVNVPLNAAFRMVMQVTGLTYYIDNNTLVIASASAAQSLNLSKQELMIIPIKYVDATSLAKFLNKNIFSINKPGLSNAQIAVTNPSANEILIFGTKNDYLMAQKVIAQFDKKPLEETFVVNHTTPKEMATLICSVLFKSNSMTDSDSAGSTQESTSSPGPQPPVTPGSPTGGAAGDTSSSSSSGSGGSAGATAGGSGAAGGTISSTIALGEGVIACQYSNPVKAGNLSSLNNNNLSVTYFQQRGTIEVMGGSAQQLEMVRDFIAANDKKQPQAYLEVSILELSESGSKAFNNTWNVYSGFFSGTFNGNTTSNSQYPMFVTGDNVGVSGDAASKYEPLYSLGRYAGPRTVTYTMDYLIKNGKARVLANPRIMITNGQTSKIDLSSDYIKMVTSQILTNSGSLTPTVQKTYTIGNDEGITVTLMPFISPEGYVTLNISPQYSTEKEKVYDTGASATTKDLVATLLQRRNLTLNNIRIKDNETLVIGGMIRDVENKTISKIPVLGDLPGIGMVFRNTSSEKTKEELVIMITPKIIKESEDIVNTPNTTL